ncbi:MAG: T9SS type A sorting domain-containing protein [Bacteroidales bacterium]|nr:T9SS type A sorting domain-containing protein [Bacteroidales bacterium]
MKNLILLLVAIFNCLIGFAQWQSNGNDIYFNDGNVGIGTNTMNHKFEVFDNNSHFLVNEGYSPTWQSYRAAIGIGYLGEGHAGVFIDGSDGDFVGMDYCSLIQFNDLSLELSNKSNSQIDFGVGGDYFSPSHIKMSILYSGNVGIGTKEPFAKLQIADGDIYISDINKGIIMKSPNGKCWRGTLNNEGVLQFNEITCPDLTTSINPSSKILNKIRIYPNPTENQVEIIIEYQENVSYELHVLDINGRVLKTQEINQTHTNVNIIDLQSGVYIFKIFDIKGNIVFSRKIIKT